MKHNSKLIIMLVVCLLGLLFAAQAFAATDSDEDGIPDMDDGCPYEAGDPANNGCPLSSGRDDDGDGFDDETTDNCPGVFGLDNGCPAPAGPVDMDGDGFDDETADNCPGVFGLDNGCPVEDKEKPGKSSKTAPASAAPASLPPAPPVFDLVKLLEFTVGDTNAQMLGLVKVDTGENNEQIIHLFDVSENGEKEWAFTITAAYIAQFTEIPSANTQLWVSESGKIALYQLTTGEFQINIGPDINGNMYEVIFDTVPDYNPYRKHWNIYNMGS